MSSGLDRELWERISTIFNRAIDTTGAERTALLDQLCGSDATVRREVENMLQAHENTRGLIAERRLATDGDGDLRTERAAGLLPNGARIGPYRIECPIGAGGMGDVYRAERADGAYRQTVALKVLRLGYRTSEMVRRFRIEREALARLTHPDIARILDGGTLDDGRPYIVLEFVEGVSVTNYCTEHSLSLRDRLALFVRIASAVQYAHGRLVVHRDLKPSNILVQSDGVPRLLDFGIAKLLDADDDASLGLATSPEGRLLTPEYAAPEQIRGEAPGTATDVYALGVLLFEMLTGARPFTAASQSATALEHAILESPPPPPSSVSDARVGARRLRGDLDRIVLMSLRKEPERRYVSAGQLGDDVERYLSGRPILARPESVGYRFRKFIGRNRTLVMGGVAILLLVSGFAITAALQARRISRERDLVERERAAADQVLAVLTSLFEQGDPNKHPGGDTLRVSSLLDEAEKQIDSVKNDPSRHAALLRAVGGMRMARGEHAHGLELLTQAFDLRRRNFGPDDVDAARIHHEMALGQLWYRGGMAARPVLDSSLTELRRLLSERHREVRAAINDLLMATYDSVAAQALLARLEAIDRVSPDSNPVAIAERLNDQGARLYNARRSAEALALFRSSLAIVRRHLPPEHSDVRTVERNVAMALVAVGQLSQAEAMQRAAVALEDRLHRTPLDAAVAHEALALTLVAEGNADSAEVYEREAVRLFRAGTAPEHWRIWSALRNLAFIRAGRGELNHGLALLDSAIAVAIAGRASNTEVGYLNAQRITFLVRLKRLPEAARALSDAEQQLGASPAVTRQHRADVNRYAGMLELVNGNVPRAVERFRAAVSLNEPATDTTSRPGINSCLLGVALSRLGRHDEARPLLGEPCTRYLSRGLPDSLIAQWVARERRGKF
jgi:eukaryotic-like serine/threonine-protein kinase